MHETKSTRFLKKWHLWRVYVGNFETLSLCKQKACFKKKCLSLLFFYIFLKVVLHYSASQKLSNIWLPTEVENRSLWHFFLLFSKWLSAAVSKDFLHQKISLDHCSFCHLFLINIYTLRNNCEHKQQQTVDANKTKILLRDNSRKMSKSLHLKSPDFYRVKGIWGEDSLFRR